MADVNAGGQVTGGDVQLASGDLVALHGVAHRLLMCCADRAILTDLRSHVPWLLQEDGLLVPPTRAHLAGMLAAGSARRLDAVGLEERSPTAGIRRAIEMLDEAKVRQGDKAIWLFLAKAWTPDLVQQFGPFDDPWRIRRWRADLRKASR